MPGSLPTARRRAIFTPPDFDQQASDADQLAQLKADFTAMLGVIDTVIDLDSRTRIGAAAFADRSEGPALKTGRRP